MGPSTNDASRFEGTIRPLKLVWNSHEKAENPLKHAKYWLHEFWTRRMDLLKKTLEPSPTTQSLLPKQTPIFHLASAL